jgi:hypothetical protein
MANADSSFNTLRFDAVTQKLQYVVGSAWVDVPTAAGGVTSVTGTTHQIVSSPSTGAVVLSLPSVIAPAVDSAQAFNFTEADGLTSVLDISTTNRRVGINTTTPSQPLEVNGNVAIDGQLVMGGGSPSGACLIDMNNIYVGLGLTVLTDAQMAAVTPNRMGNILWNSTANALYANNGTTWAAVGGGGSSTPNTAQGTLTSAVTTSSTSFVSTGLTVTLAASTATSPLLIMVSSTAQTTGSDRGYFTIFRDYTTNIASPTTYLQETACNSLVPMAFQTLYTPGDTASHTYTVYMESAKADALQFNQAGNFGGQCQITVVDLSA